MQVKYQPEQGSHKGCPYKFEIAAGIRTNVMGQTREMCPEDFHCRILRHLLSVSCLMIGRVTKRDVGRPHGASPVKSGAAA